MPLTVTVSAAPSPPPLGPRRSRPISRHVRAAQVADDDVVGAAQGPEVDALDVVEVHRHVGDVAEEEDAPAVGHDVDVLAGVGAEEEHRVGAVLALDGVVAVARIPLEHVVAGAHEGQVVAVVAEDEVVAVAAEEHVGALRAEEHVVAGAAVDRQLDDAGGQRGRRHAVVAAQGVDDERVVGPLGVGDVHLGRQPEHGDRGPRAEDVDDVVAVGAVDDDDVGRASPAVPPIVPAWSMLISTRSVPVRSLTVVVSVPPRVLRSMASTSLRSMTMVPRLRVNRTPLAVGRGLEDLVAAPSR